MNIVFFGTPDFAIPSLEIINNSDHNIVCVVTTPKKKSGRGLKYKYSNVYLAAKSLNLTILEVDIFNKKIISYLYSLKADIFIIVAFKILPEKVLKIPKLGCINLHASKLPKYRGASPINYTLLNGDQHAGLTTFLLDMKVDTGNILLQEEVPITNEITYGDLYIKLSKLGAFLIRDTIKGISNSSIIPSKQDNNFATFAPKINNNIDCRIIWNNSCFDIHNKIRAFSPRPGAFTYFNNKRVKLFKSKIYPHNINKNLLPGEIYYKEPYLLIGTATQIIRIEEIQLEGKTKHKIPDFIMGYSHIIGKYFE